MGESQKNPSTRPRLGRGLSSLISSLTGQPPQDPQYSAEADGARGAKAPIAVPSQGQQQVAADIPVDQIGPNPFQPRREFPPQELADLAASIAKHGVLQPIRVTKSSDPASACPYTLVAGERRLRAAKMAGRRTIPAVASEATQEQMLQWAVIENIHRSDLNPIERAEAYSQFITRFKVSQADLAETLGEPRTTVANYLRILELHNDIRSMIASGALSFGHAKVLAGLAGRADLQLRLARKVQADALSVRQLEGLVAEAGDEGVVRETRPARPRPAYIRDLEERLSAAVGTRVAVRPGRSRNAGRIVIDYYSLEDFDRISGMLGVRPE
jgi:ParB family chromosome partitioning protein